MPQQILSNYLAEIARIRATRAGTGEISYYGALAGALNAAGERLKPRVFCVPNTSVEVRYVRDVARRLAALRLMAVELDANYRACAAAHRPLDAAGDSARTQ